MKSGQTFVVDSMALTDVAEFLKTPESDLGDKFNVGDTFGISKSEKCDGDVIRASRWVPDAEGNLKPKKGRPRRFPRATVARLLGETDDRSLTEPTAQVAAETAQEDEDADLEAHAQELLEAAPATSEASSEDASW